jgi:hypothetical protein
VAVVVMEKRTGSTAYAGTRSFYSADAATEAGVNWLRNQPLPPAVVDTSSRVFVANAFTPLTGNAQYRFNVAFLRKRMRSGWSAEFKDYEYRVDATGASAGEAQTTLEMRATRFYREGY